MTYKVQPQSIYDSATDSTVILHPCSTEMRLIRDRLLAQCDWTQAVDSPLSDVKKAEWATYRQKLRDLPAGNTSETDLTKVDFPDIPT
jgi:hypothetical protein